MTLPLIKAWDVAKEKKCEQEFSKGCVTEDDYAKAVEKLMAWWIREKPPQAQAVAA